VIRSRTSVVLSVSPASQSSVKIAACRGLSPVRPDRRPALTAHRHWPEPLALLHTEISWGSALLGAGLDFATNLTDDRAAPLMRSIQRKVSSYSRFELLVENATLESA